jgi:GNAT superfamily N-acetyltransferase
VIRFRPFRNSDPPRLVDIWRCQPPARGLMQPMSTDVFEQLVLSKPYFDRHGLIVAERGGRPVAFVHAGFGTNAAHSDIAYEWGVVCMLLVLPKDDSPALRGELLAQAEQYLRQHGAQRAQAGGLLPQAPFYVGLYGGSDLPGVLISDDVTLRMYQEHGYHPTGGCRIVKRELGSFRPPVSRDYQLLRRRYEVQADSSYVRSKWWEACLWVQNDQTRFRLLNRLTRDCHGETVLWDMEPIASGWGVHAMGIVNLRIDEAHRYHGLGRFLVSEAMLRSAANGASRVQTQVPDDNQAAQALFRKLGFTELDRGLFLEKSLT